VSKADKRRRRLKAHREAARTGVKRGDPARIEPTEERLRRGEVRVERILEVVEPGEGCRDRARRSRDPGPSRVEVGRVRRDLSVFACRRLLRFGTLTPAQLAAAERLERDWRIARLEPRMIADLDSLGVASGWRGPEAASHAVLDARARVQAARTAMRRGGPDVLRAVEAVVIEEATPDRAGLSVYSGRRDLSVYVRTLVGIGLNLLADCYRTR